MVEATTARHDQNRLSGAEEIVKTLPHQPFYTTVVNTLETSISLPENMEVATLDEAPSKIVPVQEKNSSRLRQRSVYIYMGKQSKKQQFDQHQDVIKIDEGKQDDNWKNQLDFNQKNDVYC